MAFRKGAWGLLAPSPLLAGQKYLKYVFTLFKEKTLFLLFLGKYSQT
jgi:hypothetical protein